MFARKCQEYAQVFYPKDYYILSAKYGFLHSLDIISENYNATFKDSKTNPIKLSQLVEIAIRKGLFYADKVIVLAGRDYIQIVKCIFHEMEIVAPFIDCKGNGFMM